MDFFIANAYGNVVEYIKILITSTSKERAEYEEKDIKYCTVVSYGCGGDIRLVGDKIDPEEYNDPLKPYVSEMMEAMKDLDSDKVLADAAKDDGTPPVAKLEEFGEQTFGYTEHTFFVKQKDFIKLAMINDGSPATYIAGVTTKVLHEHKDLDKDIAYVVYANQRPSLNVTKSFQSNIGKVEIRFPHKLLKHSPEFFSTAARGKIMLYQEEENFFNNTMGSARNFAKVLSLKDNETRMEYFQTCSEHSKNTFHISYTGVVDLKVFEDYFDEVRVIINPKKLVLLIEVFAFKDAISVTFNQRYKEDMLPKLVMRHLEERGVKPYGFESKELLFARVALPEPSKDN